MTVDTARAEAEGRTTEYEGRTYAFCRAGCLRAFREEPETYAGKAQVTQPSPALVPAGGLPVIDEGMRLWYEKCSCCLSDAFPEVKAALDAERAAAAVASVDPGICEIAEAHQEVGAR
jgi:YHS domain-containing protein